MSHFDNSHSVWMREKMPFFEVWVSTVLMQNPGIWNFNGSLTLNNGKLISYFLSLWYDIHEDAAFMDVLAFFWSGFLRSLPHDMLNCQLM